MSNIQDVDEPQRDILGGAMYLVLARNTFNAFTACIPQSPFRNELYFKELFL